MILVKFSKDWADEFQVEGHKIYNSIKDWKKALALDPSDDLYSGSFYFGTNEGWDAGEITERDFTVTEITKQEAATINKLFGKDWGHFPYYL